MPFYTERAKENLWGDLSKKKFTEEGGGTMNVGDANLKSEEEVEQ